MLQICAAGSPSRLNLLEAKPFAAVCGDCDELH
jgi:hypothetical protein